MLKESGAIKKDSGDGTLVGKYALTVTVAYDPDVPLFYLVDSEGSTMEKIEVSDMEERYPSVHRRFMAAARPPAKPKKKGAKKNPKRGSGLRRMMRGT